MLSVMPYEIEANGQRILLRLSGEIDLQLTPQIKQIAIEAINSHPQATQFCIDAPEVSHIDSSGIAVLVYLMRESEQRQGFEDYFRHSPPDHLPNLLIDRLFSHLQELPACAHDDRTALIIRPKAKGDLALS